MMRWRSEQPHSDSPDLLHAGNSKSRGNFERDATTSITTQDLTPESNELSRKRVEEGERSVFAINRMSSAVDQLIGQQQSDQQDDSQEHDNSVLNNKNKRSISFQTRGVAGSEIPDTDTETTATSAAVTSHADDDDGGDHATEDDETRSQTSMPWKPQNIQSTCEFTHSIMDYAQKRESGCKKAEYSSVTTDELGNRWRLIVYVNGNGRASNHHLSLFLQVADADDLPFGWKKSVSYVLTLEHPAGGSLSYAKRNPDKTFKLCPKAIDWGWSQFITSDRIQQEGFVHADSLTVRAQVTVKSSSVEIDEEDSELYLKCAVEEGDATAVKLCLEQGASVNCQFKDDLYTPLHTACSSGTASGSMEVLQLLLEKGADGNACNKWRETPLLIAANNGHRLAVEALLQHGANPSLCSEAGWSALTFAAHKGYDDIVSLLLRAGAPVNCPVTEDLSTPLHKACAGSKQGHLAAVKLLLDGGANVHALNKWRETPLLTAANHGQAGAVEALLAAGADPCKCTDTGWSPLSIAAYKGHDDVVRILLEEGAPTEEDDPTLSALLQAATKGLPDTVELLLRHGADHTVTTKKGDTALSILVEQNLIDAAVEMVTEYNASIPRCSRDRKKVQRARLLINLRMKQLEKEGKENPDSTDDEDSDDYGGGRNVAQHFDHEEDNDSCNSSIASKDGKKKKKNYNKLSAEEKARAAEEALLLELEQEDAQAKKVEAEASSKRAKKKKKRERERQQKLKEEVERQQREEQEVMEREEQERIRKEKEEKERKERELKLQKEKEREIREIMEKEKHLAAKRKEREDRERREKEPKQFLRNRKISNRDSTGSESPVTSRSNSIEKRGTKAPKSRKVSTDPTPNKKILSPKSKTSKPVAPLAGNRRWETALPKSSKPSSPRNVPLSVGSQSARIENAPMLPESAGTTVEIKASLSHNEENLTSSADISPQSAPNLSFTDSFEKHVPAMTYPAEPPEKSLSSPIINGPGLFESGGSGQDVEHPAISLFRRDKLAELLHRCSNALTNLIDSSTLRRVIYRWITRASHSSLPYIDPMIPSWSNVEELVTFFQRQFIGEGRRLIGQRSLAMASPPSVEALKDAGSSVAVFCQTIAKQVHEYKQRIEEQLPKEWTDVELGMSVSGGLLDGNATNVSWSNQAHVVLPTPTLTALRDRYVRGPNASRFLASVFVARIWYDTSRLITKDAASDYRLSPLTQATLSEEGAVTAELYSDPFSSLTSNVFWGRHEQVDSLFGGQKPFATSQHGSEEVLALHGGSVSVLVPLDSVVASQYMNRIVSLIDEASSRNSPVSFAVFLQSECFHEVSSNGPSSNDLTFLDPRLGEHEPRRSYIRRVEVLRAGRHLFFDGDIVGKPQVAATQSVFVLLQNDAGIARFGFSDVSVAKIIGSMTVAFPEEQMKTAGFRLAPNFQPPNATQLSNGPSYFLNGHPQISPESHETGMSDFSNNQQPITTFSPHGKNIEAVHRGRRGRLFALEDDDGEDVQLGDVDLMMSGMFNNLDVAGLFKNTNNVGSDNVDIEAISLMGIGPLSNHLNGTHNQVGRLG